MLRPATPLAVILLVAFALLLLSVISTPIVKGIPLASYQGVDYGVFGYCQGTQCSGIKIGYTEANSNSFSLPASTRHSLSSILIVHPIAAFLTLICFILAVVAHFHAAAHSSRYHLGLIILLFPTILITLLAFLVDILLFIPHLAWGGWIVLASTILLVIGGIVTCAMRRMLVSRKARQRRIADNPDMNGQATYEQYSGLKADSPPPLTQQPTAPEINDGSRPEKPGYAAFVSSNGPRGSEDDRIPLNSRTPTASTASGMRPGYEDGTERYGGPGRGGMGGMRGGRGGRMYTGPRDEFGNPLPPSAALGQGPMRGGRGNPGDQRLRGQYSDETMNTMNSQGSRGRGRGGYPNRGYGRGGPGPYGPGRGGPGMNGNGRGIPLGPMAAGAGAGVMAGEMMGRGLRGPPPGYGNGYAPQGRGGASQYGRNDSPAGYAAAGYGRRQSPGPPSAPGAYGYDSRDQYTGRPSGEQYSGRPSGEQYRQGPNGEQYGQEQPPPAVPSHFDHNVPIGQAIEMDANTGSPQVSPGFDPPQHQQLRDSDSDVQGLVGLQQNRINHNSDPVSAISPTSGYGPDGSYSNRPWPQNPTTRAVTPPLQTTGLSETAPIAVFARHSPPRVHTPSQTHSPTKARMSSDNYYEDVDPRFADPAPEPPLPTSAPQQIPSLLMPGRPEDAPIPTDHGGYIQQVPQQHLGVQPQGQYLEPSSSYESFEGSRSPAESDMTSISRRGVNPDWRPAPGQGNNIGTAYGGNGGVLSGEIRQGPYQGPGAYGMSQGGVPNRRPPPIGQRTDVLAGNPDFEVGRRGTGRGGMM